MFSKIKEKYYTFAIDREDIRKLKYMYIRVYCFQEFIITIKVVFSFDLFSFSFFFFFSLNRVEEWKIIFIGTIKSINKLKFEKISSMFIAMPGKNL